MSVSSLSARWTADDPYDYDPADLLDEQLVAAGEIFAARRAAIAVLDRRATDEGVERISQAADLVPLLFSHTTYKSYPDAFINHGRWDRMCAWLATLSAHPVAGIDLDGVADIDDWVERLHTVGHHVMTTSGTTGRTSFINTTASDHDALATGFHRGATGVAGADDTIDRTAFLAMPAGATTISQLAVARMAREFAGRGEVHYLSDTPIRATDISRMARLRAAIADGTASPGDIAAAEQAGRAAAERGAEQVSVFVRRILEQSSEPLFIAGTYGLVWMVVEAARAAGLADGAFDSRTVLFAGGGLKGVQAPPDFLDQTRAFFGPSVRQFEAYGMSELNAPFARCSAGRYHAPPTTLPLILDKPGERLLEPEDGVVEGRLAALDLTVDGRWGGIISGDRVTVHHGECACGRRSPAISEIARYSDLAEGDDRLTCAGTVESYVRGSMEAWA